VVDRSTAKRRFPELKIILWSCTGLPARAVPARRTELLLERNTTSLSIVFLPGDFVFRSVARNRRIDPLRTDQWLAFEMLRQQRGTFSPTWV
jgi:hypothetical protein